MKRLLPLAAILAAMAAFWGLGLNRLVSLDAVIAHRDDLRAFVAGQGPLAIATFVAVYAALVAVSFPGASFLTITAGFLFGIVGGAASAVFAATLGATLVFLIARTSLGEGLAARAGPWLARLKDGFDRDGFLYLLALRLAPVFPFWLVNLAPALLGMRLVPYIGATALGIVPGTLAFAAIGAGLDSVIASEKATHDACLAAGGADCAIRIDIADLVTTEVLVALAALAVVALIPIAMRRYWKRATA